MIVDSSKRLENFGSWLVDVARTLEKITSVIYGNYSLFDKCAAFVTIFYVDV